MATDAITMGERFIAEALESARQALVNAQPGNAEDVAPINVAAPVLDTTVPSDSAGHAVNDGALPRDNVAAGVATGPATIDLILGGSLIMLGRATQVLRSMLVLYERGFAMDAAAVGRTLTELTIDNAYILKDDAKRVERARLYWRYEAVREWMFVEAWERVQQRPLKEPARSTALKRYQDVARDYPDRLKWSNSSIKKRAEEADVLVFWELAFSEGCAASHSGPQTLRAAYDAVNGSIGIRSAERIADDLFHLRVATLLYIHMIGDIARAFSLDEPTEASGLLLRLHGKADGS